MSELNYVRVVIDLRFSRRSFCRKLTYADSSYSGRPTMRTKLPSGPLTTKERQTGSVLHGGTHSREWRAPYTPLRFSSNIEPMSEMLTNGPSPS